MNHYYLLQMYWVMTLKPHLKKLYHIPPVYRIITVQPHNTQKERMLLYTASIRGHESIPVTSTVMWMLLSSTGILNSENITITSAFEVRLVPNVVFSFLFKLFYAHWVTLPVTSMSELVTYTTQCINTLEVRMKEGVPENREWHTKWRNEDTGTTSKQRMSAPITEMVNKIKTAQKMC